MRAFTCPVCRHLVTFENTACLNCGTELGFDWDARTFVALLDGCANRGLIGCNGAGPGLCVACALTRTRPADDDAVGARPLRRGRGGQAPAGLRAARARPARPTAGCAFDLLSSERGPVTTGHADGVITLDLAEVDPVVRERTRTELDEPYRTVLGHLRHEIGHYYQPLLVTDDERCRALFGDDRADYGAALERHYDSGPPADWAERFVSAYATMHPWEDWAETFAHYLHIRDVLQTAVAYGVTVTGPPCSPPIALRCTPIRRSRRTSVRCSTPGSRSPTRSTRSTAASARATSTRSCSRRP